MTQAALIDGKATAQRVRDGVAQAVARLKAAGVTPGLAVVLAGDDPASALYVKSKEERTREAGMLSIAHRLPADAPEADLLDVVRGLNADRRVHGVLVQLPLPRHVDEARVLATVDPDKDVDGFHVINAGRLALGQPALTPCTPTGCLMLLQETLGDLSGLSAVVLGRSNIVGKPMAQLLLQAHCTVTLAHSRTRDLAAVCRGADIVVAAVGRPEMVRGDWLKPGATVIDVGINRVPSLDPARAAEGKTRVVGDVAFAEALQVAAHVTPVPGGVGPMTIACLLANTLAAACRIEGVENPLAPPVR